MKLGAFAAACFAVCAGLPAFADGISAYLPLSIEPEIEREVERVLILADEPIMRRPISVAMVQYALTKACPIDAQLCESVRKYLKRYTHDYGINYADATGALTHGAADVDPDSHGMPTRSDWEFAGSAYMQPSDYFSASAGVLAYSGRTTPTGTMLSFGFNWAQVDIGYRDHWFSPMTSSSMLMSTEAPTMPSVTLSNYEPLGAIGFQYELFLARMSKSNDIDYAGRISSGYPRLFGVQLSIEPFSGWSLGVNRLLQYGGGDLPGSPGFLARNFLKPSGESQNEGNQQASYISRFIFPGKVPFSVYFQYAGENTEDGGTYLLGNSALSAGIDFPHLGPYLDLTYEYSEWQNTWYTHFIFLDGMTNDGIVVGNWGAQERIPNQGIGAREQMLRAGWYPPFGGYLEEQIRTVANQPYYANGEQRTYYPGSVPYPYYHYRDFLLRYSRPWKGMTVGGEILAGRDVYGKSFSRLAAFVRYGRDEGDGARPEADDADSGAKSVPGAELIVDVGASASKVHANLEPSLPSTTSTIGLGPHLALGARRPVSDSNDLGVRVEFDEVHGVSLIGVRPLDYRHRFDGSPFALEGFVGAARYNLATPAFSIYFGAGGQWRDIAPGWDLNLELRHAENLARDHVLATDVQGARPDSFYKVDSLLLYLSRKF